MSVPLPLRSLVSAAVAALLLASCAGSGGSSGASSSGSTTTPEEEATTTADAGDAAPVPSAGCGKTTVLSVVEEKTYLDDSNRWFLLSTPLTHDGTTPVPLVLDFHGLSEGAELHARMSDLAAYGDDHGFAVVQPQGEGDPTRWQVKADIARNDDLQFVSELLDQLEAKLCIDTSRVYATGLSNGAIMSSLLACTMSDRFAAVAPVAGVVHPEGCEQSRPVPILAIHGTADPILLFNGGIGSQLSNLLSDGDASASSGEQPAEADLDGPGYPAAAQEWATSNGCTGDPTDEDLTDTVIERTWACPADADVEFVIVEGGGHSWPGSTFSEAAERFIGPTDMSIDANDLIWDFFSRFALPR